jgi:hypothetical protein
MYTIGARPVVSTVRVMEVVSRCVEAAPSPFDSRGQRALVLFAGESARYWEFVADSYRGTQDAARREKALSKLSSFASGLGTVLFFEDAVTRDGLAARYPAVADRVPVWCSHASGMLQFAVWAALEAEGLAASLQHYSARVIERIAAAWELPAAWVPVAELPFGSREGDPEPKAPTSGEARVRSSGALG